MQRTYETIIPNYIVYNGLRKCLSTVLMSSFGDTFYKRHLRKMALGRDLNRICASSTSQDVKRRKATESQLTRLPLEDRLQRLPLERKLHAQYRST